MSAPLDFFPFNLPPGLPFIATWALLAGGVWLVCQRLERAIGEAADRRVLPRITPPSPTLGNYRAPGDRNEEPPLQLGVFPPPSKAWAIAWIRGGHANVAAALVAALEAEGSLEAADEEGMRYRVLPEAEAPADPLLADLHGRLLALGTFSPSTLRGLALDIARASEADFRAEAERAGFIRPERTATTITLMMAAGLLLVEVVAILRLVHRASAFPDAPPAIYLMILMGLLALAFPVYRPARRSQSVPRTDYLRWLESASVSLVADVKSGTAGRTPQVALAAALTGASVIKARPLAAPFAALRRGPQPLAFVGAACSASTCGSGGGCGSGGCGGGGGCG